jgi:flagellar motor switch protein FliN/FliY
MDETQPTPETPFEPVEAPVEVAPAAAEAADGLTPVTSNSSFASLDALKEVPLEVIVELGRAVRTIAETENLKPGSIVPLDRTHGEPLDIRVNGRLVASGEVVVIDDDNYGIRITEIFDVEQH